MLVGKVGNLAATGCAFNESLLYQIGLVNLLYCAGILAQCGGYGAYAHGAALELVYDGAENLVVNLVQTLLVDVQGFKRHLGYAVCNVAVAHNLCKVPYTA